MKATLAFLFLCSKLIVQAYSASCLTYNARSLVEYQGARIKTSANGSSFYTCSMNLCLKLCLRITNKSPNLPCYGAQFNSSNHECVLWTYCNQSPLVNDTNVITYLALAKAVLLFPLDSSLPNGTAASYGSKRVSNPPSITGTIGTTNQTASNCGSALWFANANQPFPVSSFVQAQDTAAVSAFASIGTNFTISLLVMTRTQPQLDAPLLEFLGASTGQLCAAVRLGCSGTCVAFDYLAACSCYSFDPADRFYSSSVSTSHWTHLAITRNIAGTVTLYVNGSFYQSSSTSTVLLTDAGLLTSVQRMKVGASECDNYDGISSSRNAFAGSIACVQLHDSAIPPWQIDLVSKQCFQAKFNMMNLI